MMFRLQLHLSPEAEELLLGREGAILSAVRAMEKRLTATLDDVKTSIAKLKADFEAYRDGVDAAVQAALDKASAAEAPIIQGIADDIAAVDAEIVGPPAEPPTAATDAVA